MEEAKLAAKRGAYWLDTVYPEWTSAINLSRLDLSEASSCVIGQLFGSNEDHRSGWMRFQDFAVGSNYADREALNAYHDFVADHGFEWVSNESTYSELTDAWYDLIKERT